MPNLERFKQCCLDSHDCLDSVVAAVVAALWAGRAEIFRVPRPGGSDGELEAARLEGWLYAPVFLKTQVPTE